MTAISRGALEPPAAPVPIGPCQLCKRPDGAPREIWMVVGRVELGLRAVLCDACHATAPDRIRDELRSPMIRSILAVAGARLSPLWGKPLERARP